MKVGLPENKKYVNKFGLIKVSGVDWRRESLKPRARCSFCVKLYGAAYRQDNLVLKTVQGVEYLCCTHHRSY